MLLHCTDQGIHNLVSNTKSIGFLRCYMHILIVCKKKEEIRSAAFTAAVAVTVAATREVGTLANSRYRTFIGIDISCAGLVAECINNGSV